MADIVLSKPLDIGASDLIRAVPYTYSGTLHAQIRKRFGKKWQPRYVVISQGCLYIYEDKNAKHTESAYVLRQFESVKELETDGDEKYCFCLKPEIPTKKSIVFDCDTNRTRQDWVEQLRNVLQGIQNCSADSGFGSGGSFPGRKNERSTGSVLSLSENKFPSGGTFAARDSGFSDEVYLKMKNLHDESEYIGYEEIPYLSASNMMSRPVQESSLMITEGAQSSNAKRWHMKKSPAQSSVLEKQLQIHASDALYTNTNNVDDLKVMPTVSTTTKPTQVHDDLYMNSREVSNVLQNEETAPKSAFLDIQGGAVSMPTSANDSYLSVQAGTESVVVTEREITKHKADNISCSGNTSPKTVYESPEEDIDDQYENIEIFDKKDYICDSKKQIKSLLLEKPNGTFLVCPGESTKQDLCVKTPNGDITFRIHEKDGKLSLYKECSMTMYIFPSLDALLRYYHFYELPSKKFKVKLIKGYKSQS